MAVIREGLSGLEYFRRMIAGDFPPPPMLALLGITLLDSSLGCAINTMMPPGRRFTTLELKVNLTRPLTHAVGQLFCEAKVVHLGGRTATSEGRIVDRNGKLYAHGTTTCIIVEAPRGTLEP